MVKEPSCHFRLLMVFVLSKSVRRALCDYASINLFLMVANERPRDWLLEYVRENEELESEGELLALVDDDARRIATVVVVRVETVPFNRMFP